MARRTIIPLLITFVFLSGLLIVFVRMGIPQSFWKGQTGGENIVQIPKSMKEEISDEVKIAGNDETTLAQEITSAVEKALYASPPLGYSPVPAGTRVLSVKVQKDDIVLNFSKELLSSGTGPHLEDALHQIFVKIGNDLPHITSRNYQVLIEGKPLEHYQQ